MRKIIYTVSVNPGNCFNKCVESQKRYADKIGAFFYPCTEWENCNEDLQTECEKRHIVELLKDYDKVLYLDADVFVKPDAPDIFKEYENNNNLILYNEVMHNDVEMDSHIQKVINKYDIKWKKTNGHYDWLNSGVMLCSKGCEKAFEYNSNEFFKLEGLDLLYDMAYRQYKIYKYNIPVTFLDEKFNTMVYFHSNGCFLHFANVLNRDERINEFCN